MPETGLFMSTQGAAQHPGPLVDHVADRLSRGESVPGGPGACANCGHLTLWHREPRSYRSYRGQPCQKCDCPSYTDQGICR